jgi:hypothetical protein
LPTKTRPSQTSGADGTDSRDVGQFAAFESGLIMVDNALIGTTEFDIFSIYPATCAENWRTHEVYPPSLLPANRGAAYMEGMLFRGTQDGRVLALLIMRRPKSTAQKDGRPCHPLTFPKLSRHMLRGKVLWGLHCFPSTIVAAEAVPAVL